MGETIQADEFSAGFTAQISEARARLREEELNAMGEGAQGHDGGAAHAEPAKPISLVTPSLRSLIKGTPPPKNYAQFADIFLPKELLAAHAESKPRAQQALIDNDQFDQVQIMVNASSQRLKTGWIWGEKIAGGTLEVRMNAEGTSMDILGEGYKVCACACVVRCRVCVCVVRCRVCVWYGVGCVCGTV